MKIGTFNAENLYLLLDKKYSKEEFSKLSQDDIQKMSNSFFNKNKEISKIDEIVKIIKHEEFDFLGLCEIGGKETLNNINRLFLDKKYDGYLEETNSNRGIYVGALIKKGLFSKVDVINHGRNHRFSRNLMQFTCYKGDDCCVTFFVVHLKSQNGDDFGIDQRYNEIKTIVEIIENVEHQDKPILLMGDFNGIAIRGESQFEYDLLLNLPISDVHEIIGTPIEKRYTHYHFLQNKQNNFHQLDYIFIQDKFKDLVEKDGSGSILYEKDGLIIEPLSFDERRALMPSDHIFLKMKLNI
jgi:endonuclease/exonuclease/phosphatase family metal-dependent hydrolase